MKLTCPVCGKVFEDSKIGRVYCISCTKIPYNKRIIIMGKKHSKDEFLTEEDRKVYEDRINSGFGLK
jgi:uncharacterized Zn finger protein (UPF0148 family)